MFFGVMNRLRGTTPLPGEYVEYALAVERPAGPLQAMLQTIAIFVYLIVAFLEKLTRFR